MTVLRARPDRQVLRAVERLDVGLGTERRLGHADGQCRVEVVGLALEARVGIDHQVHEERAVRATALPGRAAVGEPQGRPFLHAGGHLDGEGALLHAAPLAAAVRAGVGDHLAGPAAARAGDAGHHLPEQRLAHPAEFPGALAVEAGDGLGARGRAPAFARGAGGRKADRDLLAAAEHGLGELEVETHLGVGTHLGAAPAGAGPAHLAEERLEDVTEASLEAEAPASARLGRRRRPRARSGRNGRGARDRAGPRRPR